MSKIGNHVVEIQESPDYQFGWESAERGAPAPDWDGNRERLEQQKLGWSAYHQEQVTS